MKYILKFLRDLKRNNDREWFHAHKEEYDKVKAKVEELTEVLIQIISEIQPDASRLRVSDCTYRIYRDTRFSADKTPYKTHIGIFINPPYGKKGETAGYYLHIEPGASMFCAGSYNLPTELLRKQRQFIYDEIDEYREIVESEDFKRFFSDLGFDLLKTAPKGFPRDWEYIDYLKPRNFTAAGFLSDDFLCKDNFLDEIRGYIGQAKRYNDFLNYSLSEDEE